MTVQNIKPMIYLGLKTGFSFKETFADIKNVMSKCVRDNVIGIADTGGTYAYYDMETKTADTDIKPIYGIRLTVVKDATEKVKPRGQFGCEYILIAKNQDGIRELYPLVKKYYDSFYYRGNISYSDITGLSENIIVIAEHVQGLDRLDYIALTTTTPKHMIEVSIEENIPLVAIQNYNYLNKEDHGTYELLVGHRNAERQTHPQYLLEDSEYISYQSKKGVSDKLIIEAIGNTHVIADSVEKFQLPKAPMVRAKSKESIEFRCKMGARKRGIDITNPGVYRDRYLMEIELIKERDFSDYFIIVADLIIEAKKSMLVGPSRGSSCGSLVCYLMRITEIDPLKYGLMFERFIDTTRSGIKYKEGFNGHESIPIKI